MNEKSTAPALERGIRVLRYLAGKDVSSLDDIAKALAYPKSSLMRVLDTLIGLGTAGRDPGTGRYYAKEVLVPRSAHGSDTFDEQLELTLHSLANATGGTAEWYVPQQDAMVLVRRAEPKAGEVRVWADVGFVRSLQAELDAVAALGVARQYGELQPGVTHTGYAEPGIRGELTPETAADKIARAVADGFVVDSVSNARGVRRMACLVELGRGRYGVLALAETVLPHVPEVDEGHVVRLKECADKLSGLC